VKGKWWGRGRVGGGGGGGGTGNSILDKPEQIPHRSFSSFSWVKIKNSEQ